MNCKYRFRDGITIEEMLFAMDTLMLDDDPEEASLKDMIIKKLEDVVTIGPNKGDVILSLNLSLDKTLLQATIQMILDIFPFFPNFLSNILLQGRTIHPTVSS